MIINTKKRLTAGAIPDEVSKKDIQNNPVYASEEELLKDPLSQKIIKLAKKCGFDPDTIYYQKLFRDKDNYVLNDQFENDFLKIRLDDGKFYAMDYYSYVDEKEAPALAKALQNAAVFLKTLNSINFKDIPVLDNGGDYDSDQF